MSISLPITHFRGIWTLPTSESKKMQEFVHAQCVVACAALSSFKGVIKFYAWTYLHRFYSQTRKTRRLNRKHELPKMPKTRKVRLSFIQSFSSIPRISWMSPHQEFFIGLSQPGQDFQSLPEWDGRKCLYKWQSTSR